MRCAEIGILPLARKNATSPHARQRWCGRITTPDGVTLDPRRIDGLLSMQRPETAGDLQQFICAINWMRKGIPEHNKNVGPLQTLLLTLTKGHGAKKKELERDNWDPTSGPQKYTSMSRTSSGSSLTESL